MNTKDIPRKANRVLYFVTLALLLIFVRIWYLQTSVRDFHVKRARAPRQRTVIQKPMRGAIYDCFGHPLAINETQFSAAVSYAQIRDIPRIKWITQEDGRRQKTFPRQEHITALSHLLAQELRLDPQDVEDLIHSRAALFPNTPYTIQAGISEASHARLKMLERLFPGLIAQVSTKRSYPSGNACADVVGYMGAIAESQYLSVAEELEELETFLQTRQEGLPICLPPGYSSVEELRNRYEMLKSQAYTINDMVGKTGIEKTYDELLRGICGKIPVEVDVRGQITRHLPGAQQALSGQTLTLSLSHELQAYAEELLAISEKSRDENFANAGKENILVPPPWIKGGAIVAMVPSTGEIVACASYPSLNPNDFTSRSTEISRWLETEHHVASIWDGKDVLKKEFAEQHAECPLTWSSFLDRILSKNGQTRRQLSKINTLKSAFDLQEAAELLLHFSGQTSMASLINALYPNSTPSRNCPPQQELALTQNSLSSHPQTLALKKRLNAYLLPISNNDDKLLILDLMRLICDKTLFKEDLTAAIGLESLEQYRSYNQAATRLLTAMEAQCQTTFHKLQFASWRHNHFADYLKKMRQEEQKQNKKPKPYLDYLIKEERALFAAFWEQHRYALLNGVINGKTAGLIDDLIPYYVALDKASLEKDIALVSKRLSTLSPDLAFAYLKTMRTYRDLKEPLWGRYRLVKSDQGVQKLKHLAAAFYPPSSFGYGKSHAYRQSAPPGSVFKIATAYAALKQHYARLPKGYKSPSMLNPLTLFDETSSGSILGRFLDGSPIPRLYKGGRLPRSFGPIGKVDLLTAMERSSNIYFALLAGDKLQSPIDLIDTATDLGYGRKTGIDLPGEYGGALPSDLRDNQTGLYSFAIGQHSFDGTPLQTAVMLSALANGGEVLKPHILKHAEGSKRQGQNPLESTHFPFKHHLENVGI
ncbi:MAG: hypothetical protein KDK44_00455, partial [Chlamydiia bacterium]|nr:hypothetical protein [Chlamydiia bacterium]